MCNAGHEQPPCCADAAEAGLAAEARLAAVAAADASQQQTHTVTAASDDADVDVEDDDNSPADTAGKKQNDRAADDDAQDMQVDMGDDMLVEAEDDPGQVGLAAD